MTSIFKWLASTDINTITSRGVELLNSPQNLMVMRKRKTYQLKGNILIYLQILNSLSKEKYGSNKGELLIRSWEL